MKKFVLIFAVALFSNSLWSKTQGQPKSEQKGSEGRIEKGHDENHDHKNETKESANDHDDHGAESDGHSHAEEKAGHDHGSEGHADEESGNVGPDKGILEASEEKGFKLSPQAVKNFELKTQKLSGSGPWTVPHSAKLLSGEEMNIYRQRDGYFKRIDFNAIKRTPQQLTLSSKDLRSGDEVVVNGIGFLRIAELTAFGGAPEGHSH